MQTDTTTWCQAYAHRARLLDSNPDISIGELAQRLDMLTDDAEDIAAILRRWAARSASPGRGEVWDERTNAL